VHYFDSCQGDDGGLAEDLAVFPADERVLARLAEAVAGSVLRELSGAVAAAITEGVVRALHENRGQHDVPGR
jgi:hypothetical protein